MLLQYGITFPSPFAHARRLGTMQVWSVLQSALVHQRVLPWAYSLPGVWRWPGLPMPWSSISGFTTKAVSRSCAAFSVSTKAVSAFAAHARSASV